MAKKKQNGQNLFIEYFSNIYGERWENLHHALTKEDVKIARSVMRSSTIPDSKEIIPACFELNQNSDKLRTQIGSDFKAFYIMDLASVIAARALEIHPMDDVLDMCAAPGGKALILAEQISGGTLTVNDPSRSRRERLKKVINEYLPLNKIEQVKMFGKDGITIGMSNPESFDKILVDAPCSGEKHVMSNPKELEKWGPKRSKRLSSQQYGLLCSALLALRPNGQIVYSTCSINPQENDQVIEKLISKKGKQFKLDLDSIQIPFAEKTKYGYIFLPDKAGFGPIYFTRLKKSK